ncbi:transmembrane protein 143-like [Patiria miniata]|uniref:Transmembrane protein 143 n=1 Tax=Patiria miniata TaxID=46514 RepID=A0A914BRD5_PATMI|nr:transmembrane protein 143-like [Patiria miniata]XP_038078724.1 transmembrane protein 143-like [Patiria miniata]
MATSYCKIGRSVLNLRGRVCATNSRARLTHLNSICRSIRIPPSGSQLVQSRTSSTATGQSVSSTLSQSEAKERIETHPVLTLPPEDQGLRERFIPISRRSLVRLLMQEEGLLTSADQEKFEELAVSLDWTITNQYHGVLAELKQLFDPVNPDQDTMATRFWRKKDVLDSEFWLLRKLVIIMGKANFHELPRNVIEKALAEHVSGEGVSVSVNPKKYDILRFWALGKELPKERVPLYKRLFSFLFYRVTRQQPPAPIEYYKRVVLAVRPKGNNKLILKMFKEIPTGALEQLLPDGKIQMTRWDQGVLGTAIAIGSLSLLVKGVTLLADIKLDWTLITASVTGLMALSAWNKYKNRRTRYMMQLSRTLYFKNVANNRGVLTLLVDRAQEETFKEALLTYAFLLAERPPSFTSPPSQAVEGNSSLPVSLGGIPASLLERKIESWVKERSKATVEFDSTAGTRLLETFGILRRDEEDNLSIVSIDAALHGLPRQPLSMATRDEEPELDEGYDREMFESEEEYRKEERRNSKWGWQ